MKLLEIPKVITNPKKVVIERAIIIGLGILLSIFYFARVRNIYTIWEIPDEGGYLFNASMAVTDDWIEVFSNMTKYYGYGYSLLLIPLFFVCDTGIALVRGCIIINSCCVICLYFVQVYLMSQICGKGKSTTAVVSFVACLYPYLVSSAMKVFCEVFLSMQFWLVALLIYKSLKVKKKKYYVMLGSMSVFMFYIHTRSFVVVGVVVIIVAALTVIKKIELKNALVFGGVFVISLAGLYILKINILNILGTGHIAVSSQDEIGNVITGGYIFERIRWILNSDNIPKYILCAVGKIFYMTVSTAGTFAFGIIYVVQKLRNVPNNKLETYNETHWVMIYFLASIIFVYLICCLSGTGDTYAYMLYGRYYECCMNPIIIMGFFYLLKRDKIRKVVLGVMLFVIIAGLSILNLELYVTNSNIKIDTNRLTGISNAIVHNDSYASVILYLIIITVLCCCLYLVLNKNKLLKYVIPLIVLSVYMINNKENIKYINAVNKSYSSDLSISEYITHNIDNQEIYFVYEDYKFNMHYQRMQVFIKNHPMHVIFPDEIKELGNGAFIITYVGTDTGNILKEDQSFMHVMGSITYELFVKHD